jgi:hypothetical protein
VADLDTLRISIDTKAKVKIGEFSRNGEARGAEPVKALDHDMSPDALLVPLGILELNRGTEPIHQPMFIFGHSKETSDFIADGLDLWWAERKTLHLGVKRLHIELDNGPEIASSRTQFMSSRSPVQLWRNVGQRFSIASHEIQGTEVLFELSAIGGAAGCARGHCR